MTKKKNKTNYMEAVIEKHKGSNGEINHFKALHEMMSRVSQYVKKQRDKFIIQDVPRIMKGHECKMCNHCCDMLVSNYGINVLPHDIMRWMQSNIGLPLVSVSLAMTKSGFISMFIDRKEDFIKKKIFHSNEYVKTMSGLNPSLKDIKENDMQQCVFLDSITNRCSIYMVRPLTCVIFPYVLKQNDKKEVIVDTLEHDDLCPKESFEPGTPKNAPKIAYDLLDMLANQEGLELFFNDKLQASQLSKDPTQVRKIGMFYEYLVTVFYHLFNEFTNIEEVHKAMHSKGETKNVE